MVRHGKSAPSTLSSLARILASGSISWRNSRTWRALPGLVYVRYGIRYTSWSQK